MTRETKIGLLVGLAFIIVIGILLSDHIRATGEPPEAVVADAGPTARGAMATPGVQQPAVRLVMPSPAAPNHSVPTHEELTRPAEPVIPSTANNTVVQVVPPPAEDHGADLPTVLSQVAQRNGEPIVPANLDGTPRATDAVRPLAAGPRQYVAQPGDSVSRMALRLLGANTTANRQAIIAANPSLHDDPDWVVVGQSYWIPVKNQPAGASVAIQPPASVHVAPPAGEYYYTVQEGDSLWRIANDELDDPSAVDAIKELNAGVLKGENHDIIVTGMKLRLPAKPVASIN